MRASVSYHQMLSVRANFFFHTAHNTSITATAIISIMTYQKPTPNYNNADEAPSSSFLSHVADASPSSVSLGHEEARAAMKQKQKHARPVAVLAGVCVAGIMLLVAAGRYRAGAGAATGRDDSNSIASVVSVQKDVGGKFDNCEKATGTFQQRSCAIKHYDPNTFYWSVCVDKLGTTYEKKDGAAETCFGLGSANGNRCWTKYHFIDYWVAWEDTPTYWRPCVPNDISVHGHPPVAWQYALPLSDGSCGKPCDFGFTDKFPVDTFNNL